MGSTLGGYQGFLWCDGSLIERRVMSLKIALISDLHHGPDRGTKFGSRARELFTKFVEFANGFKPALVVELGDRITDVDQKTDELLEREAMSWFDELESPRRHLLGNHDVELLSVEDNERICGVNFKPSSEDSGGYHLVFWRCAVHLDQELGFSLRDGDIEWLENDLSKTTLPTIVFSHVPLDNGSFKGNFYFEKAWPQHASYPAEQGERVREVLERSGKVILCVNGHAHWNAYHCIDGIHYVTIPSLTETFPTYPNACESWAALTIGSDIHLKVSGNLPIEYRLPIRKVGEHWVNIHKDYSPVDLTPK